MTFFSAIAFVTFIVVLVLSVLVYARNPKSPTNRSCSAMLALYAGVIFIEFGYRHSHSEAEARFWWNLDFFWPAAAVSVLYFALYFSKRYELLARKAVHFLIIAPAAAFVLLELFTEQLSGPPVHHAWGWAYSMPDNLLGGVVFAWLMLLFFIAFVLVVQYRRKLTDVRKRKQASLIAIAILIGFCSSIFESVIKADDIGIPPMLGVYWIIIAPMTAYTIWRYDVFALSPITAAENIVAVMADSLLLINCDFEIEASNAAARHLLEYDERELHGKPVSCIFDAASPMPQWMHSSDENTRGTKIKYIDTRFRTKNGRRVPIWLASSPLLDDDGYMLGYMMIGRDITERNRREQELQVFKNHLEKLVERRTAQLENSIEELKQQSLERERAEKERESLEVEKSALTEQLYHAQKLESVGRLAGGVAHDFNNLLFVINTYSEGFLQNATPEDSYYNDFKEIYQAATRATSLTQQLLAFSRKQIVKPKVVDINDAIHQLKQMMGRLIGEHIHIDVIPGINLGPIRIDPGQLDQVLMNLAVNARDAMPSGGSIVIETNQVTLTYQQMRENALVSRGPFIVVRFADTGHGIESNIISKIFDPFFSTKAPGKGTGLGLSTIYGILKQNNGFVEVDSRVGEGSTFKLYFPMVDTRAEAIGIPETVSDPKGSETILLVEDDDQVRNLASRLLRRLGYRVIEAESAGEAARIFYESRSKIDLLFTDVVMPGMSGRQLSKLLGNTKPTLKVLFMSGYNEEITDRLGNLDRCANFLAKPFSYGDLSQKVRQVLDG